MTEDNPDSGLLWTWRILGGLPVIASPIVLFGALFALLANGITPLQQLHALAVAGYPVAYLVGWIQASGAVRAGDMPAAVRHARMPLLYLVVVLALWPFIGFQ